MRGGDARALRFAWAGRGALRGWDVLLGAPLLATALMLLAAWSTPLTEFENGFDYDGVHYGAMALSNLPAEVEPLARRGPYCYRVLSPWLVSLGAEGAPLAGLYGEAAAALKPLVGQRLPANDLLRRFYVLSLGACWLIVVLVYAWLRTMTGRVDAALLGTLLYASVFWTLRFSLYAPAYIDDGMQVFVLAVLLVAACGGRWWLLPLVALAAVQKETTLLLLPVLLALRWQREVTPGPAAQQGRAAFFGWAGALVLVAVATTAAVRLMVTAVVEFGPIETVAAVLEKLGETSQLGTRLLLAVCSGTGLLVAVVALRGRTIARLLRGEWWAIVYLGLGAMVLVGGSDKARLFLPVLPLLVLLATRTLLPVLGAVARGGVSVRVVVGGWLLVTVGAHAFLGGWLEPMPDLEVYRARFAPVHALDADLPGARNRAAAVLAIWGVVTLVVYPHLRRIWRDHDARLTATASPAARP